MAIGRDQAASIALEYVLRADKRSLGAVGQRSSKPRVSIRHVLAIDEIHWARPRIYGLDDDVLSEAWIAYVDRGLCRIGSSEIVVVSKETGEVLYHGSANDEG
jgi:hypothetical protein